MVFGQRLVDRLVPTHTNLKLEQCLELYEVGLIPWDIEMTVEEPVSDDEDGSLYCYISSSHSYKQTFQIDNTRKWGFIKKGQSFWWSTSKKNYKNYL